MEIVDYAGDGWLSRVDKLVARLLLTAALLV
jgi:hypothetical protein